MTNWREEVNSLRANSEREISNRAVLEQQKEQEQKASIELEKSRYYREVIIPGFEVLDRFRISETLTEVRDQIWKAGEIIKSPKSIEQFSWPVNSSNQHPQYSLKSPTYLKADFNNMSNYSEPSFYSIRKYSDELVIGTNNTHLYIGNLGVFGKNISLNENDETILAWLKQQIVLDSSIRPDYSKIVDPTIFDHPKELEEFYRNNPGLRPQQPKPSPRSFFDKLFGN